jgi:hypothetical protein
LVLRALVLRALLGVLAACGLGCAKPASAPAARDAETAVASELHAAFPKDRPGFGITDYPGHAEGDVPKAYAMVLLAELARLDSGWRSADANLARVAGAWLLEHADSNRDGTVGWGLPVAWDAYEDGSTNAAHTEYTISTAIVVDALLSWAEVDAQAPDARIRSVVAAALAPYLETQRASPSGMAPYSLAEADRRYDTFNPAAYLAGQMQRFSLQLSDRRQRARHAAAADAAMRALLQHKQVAANGSWYWNYSVQQALPNDLPHAGYVIAGIRAYAEYGGRLGEQFDGYAVLSHLRDFRGSGGEVRAFPAFATALEQPARSYDLGFALHLACSEPSVVSFSQTLLDAVSRYRTPQARYLKLPRGTPAAPELVVNEYEAYLYRGVTTCALQRQAQARAGAPEATRATVPLQANGAAATLAQRLVAPRSDAAAAAAGAAKAAAAEVVPLLPPEAGLVSFDADKRATVSLADGSEITMPTPGVPVRLLEAAPATWLFLRRHPDDALALLRYERGRLACRVDVRPLSGPIAAMPMLRAATLHGNRLHAVVYDNVNQGNWHLVWDLPAAGCPAPPAHPARLPSLEEPAGSTYEMVPSLHFVREGVSPGQRLWLVGGTMQLEIGASGLGTAQRIDGCRHIVESVATPRGPAHLCVAAAPDARTQARPLVVVAPAGIAAPALDAATGVPHHLQWSLGALRVEQASSPAQLRRLLRRDLLRTGPGGWMEFGINNEEGRIPWSQIYYLNGLLDIAALAGRDAQLLALYGPLLPELRRRLDMEIRWLDEHVAAGRYRTRAFTVDRSRALFAVQTARVLLLLHRYRHELPAPAPLTSYAGLHTAVGALQGHIDVLATAGEEARWIVPGRHHLRWPKGSAFQFDGMPVPFNHQNEWAHAVLTTADATTPPEATRAARDVIAHFVDRIAPGGRLPARGAWDYWWGRAYDGWDEPGRYSVNMPRYAGDHIPAWISFRTIDALALLAGTAGGTQAQDAAASVAALAERGLLYPFANQGIVAAAGAVHLGHAVALEYSRVSSPWELSNAAWSLARLALEVRTARPPDQR